MCVSGFRPAAGKLQREPSDRRPVPQSRMNCVPSGATSSRHGVFPPYRHVAGSTVGVEPRTPQKLNLLTGTDIFLSDAPGKPIFPRQHGVHWEALLILAAVFRSVNRNASRKCQI